MAADQSFVSKQQRTEEGGKKLTPCSDGNGEVVRREDVRHTRATSRKGGTTHKPGEEPENQDGRDVLGEDLWDLEDDEEGEAGEVDGVAAEGGFLHGGEKHWGKEKGKSQ